MTARDFLLLANRLLKDATEADWRTAVSRGYYAAFHVARELLRDLGFSVPMTDRAHKYLAFRLSNCGDATIRSAGVDLDRLRDRRNEADYALQLSFSQTAATSEVRLAENIIRALDFARQEPARTQITDAMKIYERDVLQDVTWKP